MATKIYFLTQLEAAFRNRLNSEKDFTKTEELTAILHHINEAIRLDAFRLERLVRHHCKCVLALSVYHLESEVYASLCNALN